MNIKVVYTVDGFLGKCPWTTSRLEAPYFAFRLSRNGILCRAGNGELALLPYQAAVVHFTTSSFQVDEAAERALDEAEQAVDRATSGPAPSTTQALLTRLFQDWKEANEKVTRGIPLAPLVEAKRKEQEEVTKINPATATPDPDARHREYRQKKASKK